MYLFISAFYESITLKKGITFLLLASVENGNTSMLCFSGTKGF